MTCSEVNLAARAQSVVVALVLLGVGSGRSFRRLRGALKADSLADSPLVPCGAGVPCF
jgi:hypothetical protein